MQLIVRIELQNVPVKTCLEVPLLILRELLSHEHQLLARVSHHIAEECAHRIEAVFSRAAHLVKHRAFSVYYLVMRNGENKVLRERIIERECYKIVVIGTRKRIHRHIAKHIVHPAHVPLKVEAKAADIGRLCNHRPCCRLLRDHHDVGVLSEQRRIQLLQERNSLKVAVVAVAVGTPLAVLSVIVKIQHRSNRVNTQTVYMIFLNPVICIGNKE